MAGLIQAPTSAVAKPTSSWELEDDWSERCGGSSGSRSSSIMTMSSCGMLTVGESWYLPAPYGGEREQTTNDMLSTSPMEITVYKNHKYPRGIVNNVKSVWA